MAYITIFIPVVKGVPKVPVDHSNLNVTESTERETINTDRFYSSIYQVFPEFEIYYSANEMIIQFARDCAAKQNLKFVYVFENGKWLFISSNQVLLKFIHTEL
jgi:hypothetical protein